MKQLGGDEREADQENQRHADAEHDHPLALAGREPGGEGADDDDIVAGHGQVDQDHLAKRD